jgi:hypothetical protein
LRLRELERAVDAQKAVYEKFLRDKEQIARLSVDTPAGRVIAPAQAPQRPSAPNKALILVVAMMAGLFSGVGLALVLETLSQGGRRRPLPRPDRGPQPMGQARAQDDGEAPLLAVLPRRELDTNKGGALRHSGRGQNGFAIAPAGSAYAEEMGVLAEQVLSRIERVPVTTLLVSGVGRGSSHPALSVNLAMALAERGETVLLVDGRGTADGISSKVPLGRHAVPVRLQGQPRTAYPIAGHDDLPVRILPFGDDAPAGRRAGAIETHSIIIIDGPPAGSRALAQIDLAQHVDGVIAVLPAGQQPDAGLAATCERAFGPALIGVVGQAA